METSRLALIWPNIRNSKWNNYLLWFFLKYTESFEGNRLKITKNLKNLFRNFFVWSLVRKSLLAPSSVVTSTCQFSQQCRIQNKNFTLTIYSQLWLHSLKTLRRNTFAKTLQNDSRGCLATTRKFCALEFCLNCVLQKKDNRQQKWSLLRRMGNFSQKRFRRKGTIWNYNLMILYDQSTKSLLVFRNF